MSQIYRAVNDLRGFADAMTGQQWVGIDDLEYASLLPVPLTTLRQPTREIGAAAFAAMLDRVSRPDTPVRDILLQTQLVVRRSCGASVEGATKTRGRSNS